MTQAPRTFFEKVWSDHVIEHLDDGSSLLQIDRVFLHEVTGGVSLRELKAAGRATAHPEQVFTVIDHVVSIKPGRLPGEGRNATASAMIEETLRASADEGVTVFKRGGSTPRDCPRDLSRAWPGAAWNHRCMR